MRSTKRPWPVPEVVVNVDTKIAKIHDRRVDMSEWEFRLLEHLALCPGTLVTRSLLLHSIYRYRGRNKPNERVIDVMSAKLRKKFAKMSGGYTYIEQVRYEGYLMRNVRVEWCEQISFPQEVISKKVAA